MKENKLSASVVSREIPASDSEKPIVIYLSGDSLRMVKGYFARRGIPFESFLTGNVLLTEELTEEPGESLTRDQAATLSYLPEVSACLEFMLRDQEE